MCVLSTKSSELPATFLIQNGCPVELMLNVYVTPFVRLRVGFSRPLILKAVAPSLTTLNVFGAIVVGGATVVGATVVGGATVVVTGAAVVAFVGGATVVDGAIVVNDAHNAGT